MKKQTKLGLVLAAAAVISVSVASLVSARGWVQQGADWYYVDNNGDYVTGTIQTSGSSKFYLDEDTGAMQRDYLLQDYNGNTYYFGSNGAMVTNTWVAVDSSIVDSGADYIPDNFWFYFQASGKAVKASSGVKKTTIDGKKYAFSEDGTMLTGWIADGKTVDPDENTNPFIDAEYYAGGDNDGVLRSGWVTYYDGYDGDDSPAENYTNLYFYFNTSNNTKTTGSKKINGKSYMFDTTNGIMLSGWDATDDSLTYYSGEDDGHQVKKGWVYAVPTDEIDQSAHDDDEEKYMYFNASGAIVANQMKKINGKYYVFGVGEDSTDPDFLKKGIMKTGLVVWVPAGASVETGRKFITTFDLDWANGSDLAKKGYITYGQDKYFAVDKDGKVLATQPGDATLPAPLTAGTDIVTIYNFADDGSRKDGSNTVEFSDDSYTFVTNAAGNKPSGAFAKKYYSLGIQLKASADVKYGIYTTDAINTLAAQSTGTVYKDALTGGNYVVLNTSGSKVKGKDQSYKDADGNYWLVDKATSTLIGIWTVNVKYAKASFTTKSYKSDLDAGKTHEKIKVASDSALDALFDNTNTGYNDIKDVEFTVKVADDGYATAKSANFWAYWFQADFGDKSNVWIPFGCVDNAGCSCDKEQGKGDYQLTPTDDYFLNCYWAD